MDYNTPYVIVVEVKPATAESRTYEMPNTWGDEPDKGLYDYDREMLRNPECFDWQETLYKHNWKKRYR